MDSWTEAAPSKGRVRMCVGVHVCTGTHVCACVWRVCVCVHVWRVCVRVCGACVFRACSHRRVACACACALLCVCGVCVRVRVRTRVRTGALAVGRPGLSAERAEHVHEDAGRRGVLLPAIQYCLLAYSCSGGSPWGLQL